MRSPARRAWAACLLLGLGACKAQTDVPLPLAAGVIWLSIVEQREDGWSASQLFTVPDSGMPAFVRDDRSTFVVGWTDAALEELLPADPEPLRPAIDCDPRLPAPAQVLRVAADRVLDSPVESVPPLTARWLERSCPSSEELFFDFRCLEEPCAASSEIVNGCTTTSTFEGCGPGALVTRVDWAGDVCVEAGAASWPCEPTTTSSHADFSLRCAPPHDCLVDVHRGRSPPPYSSATVKLTSEPAYFPDWLRRLPLVRPEGMGAGWANDFVLIGQQAIVALRTDRPLDLCDGARAPTELAFVDLEAMTLTRTATAPPCLYRLAPDPIGDGFLGLFVEDRLWRIGRFARDGALVASRPAVRAGEAREPSVDMGVRGRELLWTGQTLVALFGGVDGSVLVRYDPRTLETLWALDQTNGQQWSMSALGERLFITDQRRHSVQIRDLASPERMSETRLPRVELSDYDSVLGVATDPERKRVWVAVTRRHAMFELDFDGNVLGRSVPFDRPTHPVLPVVWRHRGIELLAGMKQRGEAGWEVTLTTHDRATGRFRPDTALFEDGMISRHREDAGGRLWLLDTWSATLVRLTGEGR